MDGDILTALIASKSTLILVKLRTYICFIFKIRNKEVRKILMKFQNQVTHINT